MKKRLMIVLLVLLLVGCKETIENPNEYGRDMMNIKGNVIEVQQTTFDTDMNPFGSVYYFEMGYYNASNLNMYFDALGNPYKTEEYFDADTINVEWLSEYDESNHIKHFEAVFNGELSFVSEYEMKDGQVVIKDNISKGIRYNIVDGEKIKESEIAITYDDQGKILSFSNDVESEGILDEPFYKYNKKGYVSDIYWHEEGEETLHAQFKYNKKNYVESYTEITDEGTTEYSFEYEYDKKGNWIEQKLYIDGELNVINIREYTYK